MTIHLSEQLEERIQRLARSQGKAVESIVEEAVRLYLDVAAITDVTPGEVAATQEQLAGELTAVPPWSGSQDPIADETC